MRRPFSLLTRGLKSGTSNKKQLSRDADPVSDLGPVWENGGPPVFPDEQRGPIDDDRARALLEKEMYEAAHQECWPVVAVVDIAKSVGDVSDLYTSDSSLQNLEDKVDQLASRYSEALKLLVERYREKEEREPSEDFIIDNSQEHSLDTRWTDDESFERGNLYGDALNLMLNGELGGSDDDEETEPTDHNEEGCKYFQTFENAAGAFRDEISRDGEEDMQGCRRLWHVADCGVRQQSPNHVNDEVNGNPIFRTHDENAEDEDDMTTKSSFPYVSSSYECTSGEDGKGSVTSSVRRYVGATVAEVLTSDKRRGSFTRNFPVFSTRGSKNPKDAEISLDSEGGWKALWEVTRDDEEDSIDMLFESAAQASEALETFNKQSKTSQKSERTASAPSNVSPESKRIGSPKNGSDFLASPENEIGFSPLSPVNSSEEESSYSEFDAVALTDVLMDAREDENAAVDLEYLLSGRQYEMMPSPESIISEQRKTDSPISNSPLLFQKTANWECTPRVCGGDFKKTRNEVFETSKSRKRPDDVYREGLFSGNTSDDGVESRVSQSNDGWVCDGTNVIFTKRLGDRHRVSRQSDRVPDEACSGAREFFDQRQNGQSNEEKKGTLSARACHGTREKCAPTVACHGKNEFSPYAQYSCHVFQGGNTVSTGLCNGAQLLTGKRRSGHRKVVRKNNVTVSKAPEVESSGSASDGEKTVVVFLKYQPHGSDSDDEDGVINDEEPEQKQEQARVQEHHEKQEQLQEWMRVHDKKEDEEKVEGQQTSKRIAILGNRPRSAERILGRLVMKVWRKRSMARRHFFELPSVAAPSSIRNEESMMDYDDYVHDEGRVFVQLGEGANEDIIEREPVALADDHLEGQIAQSNVPTKGNEFDLVSTKDLESGGRAEYFKGVENVSCHHTSDPSIGDGHDRQMKKGNRLSSLGKKSVPVLLRKNKSLPPKENDMITKNLHGDMTESKVETHDKQGDLVERGAKGHGAMTDRGQDVQGDFIDMTHTTEQMKKGNRLSSLGKKSVPVLLRKNKSLPPKENDMITKNLHGDMTESKVESHDKQGDLVERGAKRHGTMTDSGQDVQGDFIDMTHTTEIGRFSSHDMTHTTEIGRFSSHDIGSYQNTPTNWRKSKSTMGSLDADRSILPSHEEVIAEFSIGKAHEKTEGDRGSVTEDFVRVVSDESASSKKSRTALVFKRWLKVGKKPVPEMPTGNSIEEESSVKTPSQSSDQKGHPDGQGDIADSDDYDEPIGEDEIDERDESDNSPSSKESYVMWIPESFSSMFVAQEVAKELDVWASLPVNVTKQQMKTSSSTIMEGADIPALTSLPIRKIGIGESIFEEGDDSETNTIIEVDLPYEDDIQREESMISWISTSLSTLFADPVPQIHLQTREMMVSGDQRPLAPSTGGSVPPLERESLRRKHNKTGTDRKDWHNSDDEEDTETKDDDFLMSVDETRVLNASFRGRAVDDFLGYVADALFADNVNDKTSGVEAEVVTDDEAESTDDSFASSKCDSSINSKPVAALEPLEKNVEEDGQTEKSSVKQRRGNVIALVSRARRSFTKRQSTKNEKSPSLTGNEALKSAPSNTSKGESDGNQSESSAVAVDQSGAISISAENKRSIVVDKEQVSGTIAEKLPKSRRRSFPRKETKTRQRPRRRHPIEQRGPLDGLWEYFDFTHSIDEDEWSDAISDDDSSDDAGMAERWTYKLTDPSTKELSPKGKLSQIAEEVPVKRSKRRFAEEKNGNIARNNRGEMMRRRSRPDQTPPELARSPLAVVEGTALSLGRQVSRVADGLAL